MENSKKFLYGSMGLLFISGAYFGGLAATGIFVGFLTAIGVGIMILKLKLSSPWLYQKIIKHNVLSDFVISVLIMFFLASNTATSIIATASAVIFVSIGLGLAKIYGNY